VKNDTAKKDYPALPVFLVAHPEFLADLLADGISD
jgi:hypothetical protein